MTSGPHAWQLNDMHADFASMSMGHTTGGSAGGIEEGAVTLEPCMHLVHEWAAVSVLTPWKGSAGGRRRAPSWWGPACNLWTSGLCLC